MARASKASGASAKSGSSAKKTSGSATKSASKKASSKKAAAKTKKTTTSAKTSTKSASKKATKTTSSKSTSSKSTSSKTTTKSTSRKKKSPFDSRFLEKMRKLLVVERETYERQASQLTAEAASLVDSMEPGDVNFDEEGGEGDTIAVERGRDLALAAKAAEMVEEIDHALSKFDSGDYGICEVSGEPIPRERLEAIPWARERVEYKVGGFGRR